MSAMPKRKFTEAEYLVIERAAEFKSEFYNGEMFAVSGATFPHNRVKGNFDGNFFVQLKGSDCQSLTSDMRVKVDATGLYTYPDIIVVCGELELLDGRQDVLLNPTVIIEVLSPSTEKYDRGAKFRQYQQIKSLKEYVLAAQDEPVCERYVRHADYDWTYTAVVGLDAEFAFASVSVRIQMAEIYRGVVFPPPESAGSVEGLR